MGQDSGGLPRASPAIPFPFEAGAPDATPTCLRCPLILSVPWSTAFHCMRTSHASICVPSVSHLCPICVLFVSHLCPICVLFVSNFYPILCPICVQFLSHLVSYLCPICIPSCVPSITSAPFVSHLCPVPHLCPICAPSVYLLCAICAQCAIRPGRPG